MKYSELSLAERDTSLKYDAETASLTGERDGFGVCIADEDEEYSIKIFVQAPHKYEKNIAEDINRLAEILPKNSINSQRCELSFFEVRLNKSLFLQEKLPLMIEFSDKLSEIVQKYSLKGLPPKLPELNEKAEPEKKQTTDKKKLGFNIRSVFGMFGAIIGAAAMVFISSSLIKITTDNSLSSTFAEIGTYVLAALTAFLIFSDYRFLAKKLDAFGIIICPLLSVLCSLFTAILVTAKAFAEKTGIPIGEALAKTDELYESAPDIAAFGAGYLLIGCVISVFASIIYCLWYFRKHSDEML